MKQKKIEEEESEENKQSKIYNIPLSLFLVPFNLCRFYRCNHVISNNIMKSGARFGLRVFVCLFHCLLERER